MPSLEATRFLGGSYVHCRPSSDVPVPVCELAIRLAISANAFGSLKERLLLVVIYESEEVTRQRSVMYRVCSLTIPPTHRDTGTYSGRSGALERPLGIGVASVGHVV